MNITQILQIADWAITKTGNSFIRKNNISNHIKFVHLDRSIVHFNKDTDEVLAIIAQTESGVLVYTVDAHADQVINMYEQINVNTQSETPIKIVDDKRIITELNQQYNREPDSVLELGTIEPAALAVIDNLADRAGLTRNGYLIKLVCEQLS